MLFCGVCAGVRVLSAVFFYEAVFAVFVRVSGYCLLSFFYEALRGHYEMGIDQNCHEKLSVPFPGPREWLASLQTLTRSRTDRQMHTALDTQY